MIFIVPNVFRPMTHITDDHAGPLINYLVDKFPDGFNRGINLIYVNKELIDPENYDLTVTDSDRVVIFLEMPGDANTVAQIVAQIVIAALTYVLAPKPSKPKTGRPSRAYEIGSGQNTPALGQPIVEHFGQLWFFPDVASQPYSQFINNEQYLSQILIIGMGEYRLDKLQFGGTDYDLISPGQIEYHLIGPDQHKAQYGNVQAISGIYEDIVTSLDVQGILLSRNPNNSFIGKAYADDNWLAGSEAVTGFAVGDVVTLLGNRSTSVNNHRLVTTVTGITGNKLKLATLNNDGGNPSYQAVKDDDGWRGWFNTLPTGKTLDRLEFDFEIPGGLNFTQSDGNLRNKSVYITIEIQPIDDNDNNAGAVISREVIYTMATRDPVRRTYSINVNPGRYKVRVRRDDQDDANGQVNSNISWTGLKAYAVNTPGSFIYGDVTLLAIRIKAGENLSSTSDKISVQATRILPTIASDFTVKAPTVNPVDSFCHIVREQDLNGLDIDSLKPLGARWAGTNGFNYRFTELITVYEALQTVAAVNRATPEAYAKKLSMRQDVAKPFDQYLITAENMVLDSYISNVKLSNDVGLIDGYRVKYQDPTAVRDLYVVIPNGAVSPQETDLTGCTNQATAIAQGQYLWARRLGTRRTISFDTELDGLCYSVGDRIGVLNNVVDLVRTCRVISVNGLALTVDASLNAPSLKVRLTDQYGAPSALIDAAMVGNVLTLAADPGFDIFGLNANQEQTKIALGAESSFKRSWIVTEISPSGNIVSVNGIAYSDAPYLYPIPGEV